MPTAALTLPSPLPFSIALTQHLARRPLLPTRADFRGTEKQGQGQAQPWVVWERSSDLSPLPASTRASEIQFLLTRVDGSHSSKKPLGYGLWQQHREQTHRPREEARHTALKT